MAAQPELDEVSGVETTGHEWDGIKELNNPLPRWWLWIFYASIVWALAYWVFMPAIPGLPGAKGATPGIRHHSERVNVAADLDALRASRAPFFERLKTTDLSTIESDPDLFRFAIAAGQSAFADNCAPCHGSGAQGAKGYPNLNDDVWLWGGALAEIKQTILYGVRSEHPQRRISQMPAFGQTSLLTREQVSDLADYVLGVSGQEHDPEAALRGSQLYQTNCVICHQADGRGSQALGAPNLTDQEWLYGGDRETVYDTIWFSRAGVMPAWSGRLDEGIIDSLAVYVHSLGVGEQG
jgi:cytochrome c oxidase cbb3-type subunit 3